ncbi:MAG TPA: DUF4350 domain-containing protein [Gemmatimonadales bacterium]|nr:DUF4350 domain-containing protein [Gemmatimonadales bacterium]
MRPRDEALVAVLTLAVLGVVAGLLGRDRNPGASRDERPSTFLAGPGGSRALLEAMQHRGIAVRRFRYRPRELDRVETSPRQVLFVLDPSSPPSAPENTALLRFARRADLVLAGSGADRLMKCFGYKTRRRFMDSLQVAPPGTPVGPASPWVSAFLVATNQKTVVDSSRGFDVAYASCTVPPLARVDTLLLTPGGQVAALRLTRADRDRRVILVSDAELFRNRALRRTDAGPFALSLVDGKYDQVVFEEYHHGFGPSGSLAGAVLAWSRKSPWGWLVWQAALVGLLALLFGAVRFGLPRPVLGRTRRSPLEHVRALATALAAAKGHDVAIGAIVRGLRRRLLPPALRTRGDWRAWLAGLARSTRSEQGGSALATLDTLTRPGQPSIAVLRAANAVEDLWEDQRH